MTDALTCGLCGSERVQDNGAGHIPICRTCWAYFWNGEWQRKESNDIPRMGETPAGGGGAGGGEEPGAGPGARTEGQSDNREAKKGEQ